MTPYLEEITEMAELTLSDSEGGRGASGVAGCIPQEDEADNVEQQATELDMLQSIFEGQLILLSSSKEFLVRHALYTIQSLEEPFIKNSTYNIHDIV